MELLDHNFKPCPDRDCHDIVIDAHEKTVEHHETLYKEETGVRAVLNKIQLSLKDKVNETSFDDFKKSISDNIKWVIGLFIIIGLAVGGSYFNTWAETKNIEKETEKEIVTIKNNDTSQDKDIEALKEATEKTLESFNKFQIENAKQMGEILTYVKHKDRND